MVGDDLSQKSHQKMPFVLSLIFDLEKAVEKRCAGRVRYNAAEPHDCHEHATVHGKTDSGLSM